MFFARSGHAEAYEGGGDFGRWAKRTRRNPKRDLRPAEPLRYDGEITVIAPSRRRYDSRRDFKLNHNVDGRNPLSAFKETMQNGRGDVIRQIPIDGEFLPACDFFKIDGHHVAFYNLHVLAGRRDFAQPAGQPRVKLDGKYHACFLREALCHFAVPCANFDPNAVVDTNRTSDPLLPACVREEMLAQ